MITLSVFLFSIVSLSDANTHVQMSPSRFPKPQGPEEFSWTSPDLASAELLLPPCERHTRRPVLGHFPVIWIFGSDHTVMHTPSHTGHLQLLAPQTQALWWVAALLPWHSDLNANKHGQKESLQSHQHLGRKFNEKTCQTTDLVVQGMLMRAGLY